MSLLSSMLIPTRSTSSTTSSTTIVPNTSNKSTATTGKGKKVRFLPPQSPPPYILSSSPTSNKFNNFKCQNQLNRANNIRQEEEKSIHLHLPSYRSHTTVVDERELRVNKLDKLKLVRDESISLKFNFENEINDAKKISYKCGEYIRGNVEISGNTSLRKYKQIKISLEGRYILTVNKYRGYEKVRVPVKINKFLEMYDIGNGIDEQIDEDDDGEEEINASETVIQNFQFKIPQHLTDKDNRYFQVPPSIGDDADLKFDDESLDDFFTDSIVNYRIVVRVLNEVKEQQQEQESEEEDPIIIHESVHSVNVSAGSNTFSTDGCIFTNYRNYEDLIMEMKQKIETGWSLLKKDKLYHSINDVMLPPNYYTESNPNDNDGIELKSEMKFHVINQDLLQNDKSRFSKFLIPIQIGVDNYCLTTKQKKKNVNKLKNLKVELVIVNIKSDDGDIPIRLKHTNVIIDDNDKGESIKSQYNKPCQLLKSELYELLLELNQTEQNTRRVIDVEKYLHQVNIDHEDYRDLKTLSKLKSKSKTIPLKCLNPEVLDDKNGEWIDDIGNDQMKRNMTLRIDFLKALNQFQLLPSFQSDNLVRFYYMKLSLSINGCVKVLKIPVEI